MTTREIPTNEWRIFFTDCTKLHRRQPVTFQVLRLDIGAQEEARLLPFIGSSCE